MGLGEAAVSRLPFDHLLFTGSGQTGRALMAAAADNLCPVTLELGGKSPAIVCDHAPLRQAADPPDGRFAERVLAFLTRCPRGHTGPRGLHPSGPTGLRLAIYSVSSKEPNNTGVSHERDHSEPTRHAG